MLEERDPSARERQGTGHPAISIQSDALRTDPHDDPAQRPVGGDLDDRALEVVVPGDFVGAVVGDLTSRRGRIGGMDKRAANEVVSASVPLSEMFGYSTILRSGTQGKAEFTMEFSSYKAIPKSLTEEVIKKADEQNKTSAA